MATFAQRGLSTAIMSRASDAADCGRRDDLPSRQRCSEKRDELFSSNVGQRGSCCQTITQTDGVAFPQSQLEPSGPRCSDFVIVKFCRVVDREVSSGVRAFKR